VLAAGKEAQLRYEPTAEVLTAFFSFHAGLRIHPIVLVFVLIVAKPFWEIDLGKVVTCV
jgi:hypothetical protein